MKKIVLSIIALAAFAFSSQAQVNVTQGTLGDNSQQGNKVNIKQETDLIHYVISVYSPNSEANVKQTLNGSDIAATGNWIGTTQNGSVNSADLTQTGNNNNIILSQLNLVAGVVQGNGNQATLGQKGVNNSQLVHQTTAFSVGDNGGSSLITSQNGEGNTIYSGQTGHGVGHSASVTQEADLTNSFVSLTQSGSANALSITQLDGDNNGINVSQNNPTSDKIGNTLTITQGGGDDNYVVFSQSGSDNDAVITQDGSLNVISHNSRQNGTGHTATLTQEGASRFLETIQEGSRNTITTLQTQSESGGLVILSTQLGSGNVATITQSAGL